MCGIAGVAGLGGERLDPRALGRMCRSLAHRGPDDSGYVLFREAADSGRRSSDVLELTDSEFSHGNPGLAVFDDTTALQGGPYAVGLAHRRLSILDLSRNGHQPMCSPCGRYWIVYNGEIYNYLDLRDELVAKGHNFQGHSDTEVLLRLWAESGQAMLPKLNGMFAFAVYDKVDGTLSLVRDRFGVKPLYWARTGEFLVFASETKGILSSGVLTPELHPASITEYFAFQNLLGNRTLFRGIKIVMPGEVITLPLEDSSRMTCARFCDLPTPSWDAERADTADADEIAHLFSRAVKRQLISDVPVGAFLSGGMDSGSIVSVAARQRPRLLTFTGGFDLTNVDGIESGFDERTAAERISHLAQTEHYDVVLHSGDMPAVMESIAWHMDDLRVGMCHQNWYVMKLASRFVKVCLSGAGGDELFGGYPWRYAHAISAETPEACDRAYGDYWQRLLPRDEMRSLLAPALLAASDVPLDRFERVMSRAPEWRDNRAPEENAIQRMLYFELQTFLHGLLVTEDRISMAHGLEVRVPFLDNDLAAAALALDPRTKVDIAGLSKNGGNGHYVSSEGKRILRKAMARYLPDEILHQPKQGFSPPDENWYRGPSMEFIRSVLYDTRTRQRGWFNAGAVQKRLEEHFGGIRNHRLLIWSLLSFEFLQRHFVDRTPAGGMA